MLAQYQASERAEPAARIPHRTLWLDLLPGDKVMPVENDYNRDVYNGDLGVVSRIELEDCELVADFDGREVTCGFGELDARGERRVRQASQPVTDQAKTITRDRRSARAGFGRAATPRHKEPSLPRTRAPQSARKSARRQA